MNWIKILNYHFPGDLFSNGSFFREFFFAIHFKSPEIEENVLHKNQVEWPIVLGVQVDWDMMIDSESIEISFLEFRAKIKLFVEFLLSFTLGNDKILHRKNFFNFNAYDDLFFLHKYLHVKIIEKKLSMPSKYLISNICL